MKEVVLPVSGDFAHMRRLKFTEYVGLVGSPNLLIAMIELLVTIDGRPVDVRMLDEMDLSDAMVIAKLVCKQLEPAGIATGVA